MGSSFAEREYMLAPVIDRGYARLGPDNATLVRAHEARRRGGQGGTRPRSSTSTAGRRRSSRRRPRRLELTADATSLRVREGTGGMQTLDDDDKANIEQTIDDEVLQRRDIAFRSTRSSGDGGRCRVHGRADARRARPQPIAFDLDRRR